MCVCQKLFDISISNGSLPFEPCQPVWFHKACLVMFAEHAPILHHLSPIGCTDCSAIHMVNSNLHSFGQISADPLNAAWERLRLSHWYTGNEGIRSCWTRTVGMTPSMEAMTRWSHATVPIGSTSLVRSHVVCMNAAVYSFSLAEGWIFLPRIL